MEYLKWGILGAGGIASRRVLPALAGSSIAKVVAVMDRNPNVAETVAQKFGIPCATSSVDELLEQPLDAVYIASPVYLHLQHALAASSRRMHILVEKPLAMNSKDAAVIVESCKSSGSLLQVGYMMRFHCFHQSAREMLAGGDLGTPVFCRAQLSCWYPPLAGAWRQQQDLGGGGSLMDLGTHCIDLLEWILGSKITEVFASTSSLIHSYEVEDSVTMLLKFDNGAHGVVDAFFCIPDACGRNSLEVYGTKGSLHGDGTIGQLPGGRMTVCRTLAEGGYDAVQNRPTDDLQRTELRSDFVDLYLAEIEYLSRCVLQDNSPTTNTGQQSVHILQVMEAAYKSSSTRQAHTIGELTL